MTNELFTDHLKKGAAFSNCKNYRYSLWRIWDNSKPLVMYIGLNPSTANDSTDDPTIQSCIRLSKYNGYGGFYMMNCFPFISTDPKGLIIDDVSQSLNFDSLLSISKLCKDVVFAWGNFKEPFKYGITQELQKMFPDAKCIVKNNTGSPGHPLFKKGNTKFISYERGYNIN